MGIIASSENNSVGATEVVTDYSINQLKTPKKSSKKKLETMVISQEKSITSGENGSAKSIKFLKESSVTKTKTPKKTFNKLITVDQEETVSKENVSEKYVSADETELKESSAIETKTLAKPSKKKCKSMTVDQEKTTLCETKVKNKISGSKEKLSVLHIKTPNKKKRTSIKDEMSVSNKKVLAETTELVEECVTESKTLTKKIKRKSTLVKIGYTQKNKMEKENT